LYISVIVGSTAFPHRLQLRTATSTNTRTNVTEKEEIRPYKGLDDIVTEYFRVQHSKCSHPVTTCPPFSLFYPHRCPEPRNVGMVPVNIVTRFATRDILPYNTWPLKKKNIKKENRGGVLFRLSIERRNPEERLWKSHVIANTRVSYNEKELLQLIHDHLVRKGLHSTAEQLVSEADLPQIPASKASTTPARLPPLPRTRSLAIPATQPRSLVLPGAAGLTTTGTAAEASTPINSFHKRLGSVTLPTSQREHGFLEPTPGRDRLRSRQAATQLRTATSTNTRTNVTEKEEIRPYKGLDDIVTEYFRNKVKSKDESYVFSRFRPARTITEHEEMYTSCAFSIDDEHLIVGTFTGEVHWLNMETGAEESHTVCHSSGITSIVPSKDGNFLLTSSAYITPLSALWKLGDQQEYALDIPDEYFVQFSNLSSEKIIGTSDIVGTIYDTETGRLLRKFRRDSCPTGYTHNRASFSPCDTMVLNDGVLYDVRGPVSHSHPSILSI
ncbi:LisH, partial [Cooperia oncophora]